MRKMKTVMEKKDLFGVLLQKKKKKNRQKRRLYLIVSLFSIRDSPARQEFGKHKFEIETKFVEHSLLTCVSSSSSSSSSSGDWRELDGR